jgi:hypothetical protein
MVCHSLSLRSFLDFVNRIIFNKARRFGSRQYLSSGKKSSVPGNSFF